MSNRSANPKEFRLNKAWEHSQVSPAEPAELPSGEPRSPDSPDSPEYPESTRARPPIARSQSAASLRDTVVRQAVYIEQLEAELLSQRTQVASWRSSWVVVCNEKARALRRLQDVEVSYAGLAARNRELGDQVLALKDQVLALKKRGRRR